MRDHLVVSFDCHVLPLYISLSLSLSFAENGSTHSRYFNIFSFSFKIIQQYCLKSIDVNLLNQFFCYLFYVCCIVNPWHIQVVVCCKFTTTGATTITGPLFLLLRVVFLLQAPRAPEKETVGGG